MNIHIVQHDIVTNNPEANLEWILQELDTPESREALLTVFPACTLCGSPLFGSVAYTDIQKRAQAVLQELIQKSEHRAFLIGMPLQIQDKGLCNAIVFVQNCAIRGIITKKYLAPDEQKYFVRGEGVQVIQYQEQSIAIGFYEDLKELSKSHIEQPDMVICCGCNVFDYNKPYRIRYRMHKIVENLNASLVFVNRIGGEGSFLFAGGSMALNAAGQVLCQFPYFQQHAQSVDLQLMEECHDEKPEAVELVHQALIMGIRDYFRKNGMSRCVIGLSGGMDSAMVCALAVEALGADNVHGILMPSQYSTDHSVKDAVDLANNLGVQYDIVPIKPMFDTLRESLKPVFGDRPEDVTEENLQARIRGTIVMAYANKFGALMLNTSNKSEAAMGYGTLYGDCNGGISVIGDLYKTEVYELAEYINREREIIPINTIQKPPSAELRPGQKDSDSLPEYAILDAILNLHIEEQLCFDEIVAEGYDPDTVAFVIRRVRQNEWKRLQCPPQLKMSPMTFGLDRRVPISKDCNSGSGVPDSATRFFSVQIPNTMKKLLLLFLALMPLAAAWANGGPARPISSLTYSRSPIHQHIPEIQIVDEHLDITPLGRYSLIEVRYTLRNQSDKDFRDIPYGFPVDYYGSGNCRSLEYRELYWGHGYHVQGWSDGYVREVSFALNGANLPYQCSADTLIRPRRSIADIQLSPAEKNTLLSAHEWYFGEMGDDANFQEAAAHYRCGSIFEYESEIHRRWYYTHLAIAPHQEVVLTVRYRIFNRGFLYEEEQISIFTPVDGYPSVYYDFTPASYWGNGKADHIEINLHSHICNFDRPLYNDHLLQQKGETDLQYTADNFDLANATPLDIIFVGWHRNWYHYRKHRLPPDQYVLSLSCEDSQYPIGNLSDTNAATAAVIHPDGKGRTHICIKLREPQELAGLVIVGGYAKSRDTWYNNGRIKELKMVVYDEHGTPLKKEFPWNEAHSAKQPMDTTHTQPLDLIYLGRNQQTIEIPLSIEDHIRLPEGNYTFPYSSESDHHKISEIHLQVTEQEPGLKSKLLCVSEIIVLGKGSH